MAITPLNPGETWGEHRQKINDNDAELDSRKADKAGDTFTGPITIQEGSPQLVFDDTDVTDVDGQKWQFRQEDGNLVLQRQVADDSWQYVATFYANGNITFKNNILIDSSTNPSLKLSSDANASTNVAYFVLDSPNDVFSLQVRDSSGAFVANAFNMELDPTGQTGQINFAGNVPASEPPTNNKHLANKEYVDEQSIFHWGGVLIPYTGEGPFNPDDYVTSSVYLIHSNNPPSGMGATHYIFSFKYTNDRAAQIAFSYADVSPRMAIRRYHDDGWTAWVTFATSYEVEELQQEVSNLKSELADLKARLEAAGI